MQICVICVPIPCMLGCLSNNNRKEKSDESHLPFCWDHRYTYTLAETNSLPLTNDGWDGKCSGILAGSFRGGGIQGGPPTIIIKGVLITPIYMAGINQWVCLG